MVISAPCVVSLTWRLEDAQGQLIDELAAPVEFFFGGDDLLAKVEEALDGQEAGYTTGFVGKFLNEYEWVPGRALPGLAAIVGVDLVWHPLRGPVVIEINPRLPCADQGLSAMLGRNLAGEVLAQHLANWPVAQRPAASAA